MKNNKGKYILHLIFVIYILILLKIILFKTGGVVGFRSANLVPFKTIIGFIFEGSSFLRIFSNIVGNIGVFVPLGFLLPILYKKFDKFSKVLMVSVGLSISFELIQYFASIGSLDIDDLILNTVGGIAGYLIYSFMKKYIVDEKRIHSLSIILCCFAFVFAFSIAREEFGEMLGLIKEEVLIEGNEDIPNTEPDIVGTYISRQDYKMKLYKGVILKEDIEDIDNLNDMESVEIEVNKDTEVFLMYVDEESRGKTVITYKKGTIDDLAKATAFSNMKVWKDPVNTSFAKVIILSL